MSTSDTNTTDAFSTPRKVMVQVRLTEELVKQIDHIAVEWGLYRNETIDRLLEMALPKAWEGLGTERVALVKALRLRND